MSGTKPEQFTMVKEAEYRIDRTDYEALVEEAEKLEGADNIRDMLSRATLIE